MNKRKLTPVDVEEDGDEIFTKIPGRCPVRRTDLNTGLSVRCNGIVRPYHGFMVCVRCGGGYGSAPPETLYTDRWAKRALIPGTLVYVRRVWVTEGRVGTIVAAPVKILQLWSGVLWDGAEDPDWFKSAGLQVLPKFV